MPKERQRLGGLGEKIAVNYLKKNKYKILDRNFRIGKWGEIDIIALKKTGKWLNKAKNIIFCEVKTREIPFGRANYAPEDNITYSKQQKLIKLAKIYLSKNGYNLDIPWQIDVIAVEINPETEKLADLRHIEKAIWET